MSTKATDVYVRMLLPADASYSAYDILVGEEAAQALCGLAWDIGAAMSNDHTIRRWK